MATLRPQSWCGTPSRRRFFGYNSAISWWKSTYLYNKMIVSSSRIGCNQNQSSTTLLQKFNFWATLVSPSATGAAYGFRAQIFPKSCPWYILHVKSISRKSFSRKKYPWTPPLKLLNLNLIFIEGDYAHVACSRILPHCNGQEGGRQSILLLSSGSYRI